MNLLPSALSGLTLCAVATLSIADSPVAFDPAEFERRFHVADTAKQGKLSRAQASAAFPRIPPHFDRIDADRDGYITLREVDAAMQRSVEAAMQASQPGGALVAGSLSDGVNADSGATAANPGAANPSVAHLGAAKPSFSSTAEARRHYRHEYYESLTGSQEQAINRNDPVVPAVPAQLEKSF